MTRSELMAKLVGHIIDVEQNTLWISASGQSFRSIPVVTSTGLVCHAAAVGQKQMPDIVVVPSE
jgi:hypothetical protein